VLTRAFAQCGEALKVGSHGSPRDSDRTGSMKAFAYVAAAMLIVIVIGIGVGILAGTGGMLAKLARSAAS
jgi:hypothetical protein